MPAEPDLFAALDATWPAAETIASGPWLLRRSPGGGRRVTAASLQGPLADPDAAAASIADLGQSPLFQVREGQDELDAALAARGYLRHDPTLLLAIPAAGLDPPPPDRVIRCDAPLAAMAAIWRQGGIGADRIAVMDRVAAPRAWLLGRDGERPAACGFVAVHGGVAMLHALEVAPAARRAGLGAALTRAAAAWARPRRAGLLAVAVTEANAPARALYDALGFRPAGRYHYRAAAEPAPKSNARK
jgi:N-acetylglutamate synthase